MASHNPSGAQIVEHFVAPKSSNTIIYSLLIAGFVLFLLGALFFPPNTEEHGHDGHEHETHGMVQSVPNVQTVAQDHPAEESEAHQENAHGEAGEGHAATTDHADDPAAHESHAEGEEHAAAGHHTVPTQATRIWANLLIGGFFFAGVGLMSVLFLAISYVADAGWMAVIRRVAEATSYILPVGVLVVLITLVVGGPKLYHHWWPTEAYNPLESDPILSSKTWWLTKGKFYIRAVVYAVLWIGFWLWMRRVSLAEDKSNTDMRGRLLKVSAPFIIVFALSWSAASWDWVMSLEPHWFSTMFGVYTFASIWVSTLALITIVSVYLHMNGLLPVFNKSHLHDLGKFVFAFSIFWAYIWFCQFMLIWYANIPEETQYFIDRVGELNMYNGPYTGFFFGSFLICFVMPFFGLMTAGSKRIAEYLVIICFVIILGHWVDVSMMVLPGPMGPFGDFGLMEMGSLLFFVGLFFLVTRVGLSQAPLIAKHDRYLKESIVHDYH